MEDRASRGAGSCLPSETLELVMEGPGQENGMGQAGEGQFGCSVSAREFLSQQLMFTP